MTTIVPFELDHSCGIVTSEVLSQRFVYHTKTHFVVEIREVVDILISLIVCFSSAGIYCCLGNNLSPPGSFKDFGRLPASRSTLALHGKRKKEKTNKLQLQCSVFQQGTI